MSQHHNSGHSNDSTSGNFVALVLILSLIAVVAVIYLSNLSPSQDSQEPVSTLISRRFTLTFTPTPVTPTATATFTPSATPTRTPTNVPSPTPTSPATATPSGALRVSSGERVFQGVCAACHGFNARGISGLGPSFVGNEFVNGRSNQDLLAFVSVGREVRDPANKSGVAMPARGGNPSLTDNDLLDVIYYIRSLNPDVQVVEDGQSSVEVVVAAPTEILETLVPREFTPLSLAGITSANADTSASTDVDPFFEEAKSNYLFSCSTCHGTDGSGGPMAAPLSESALLLNQNGIALLALIADPDPLLGFAHPYRGGYPELTDDQILAIIGYMYSLTGTQQ
ncbi:MAG: cytochrome c [Anaerolineae bacterium]|nr:cytochrome c [Chloroflexota bacterium]MBP6298516.1 cytochrome c [Anaerolineae bacterium]